MFISARLVAHMCHENDGGFDANLNTKNNKDDTNNNGVAINGGNAQNGYCSESMNIMTKATGTLHDFYYFTVPLQKMITS